MLLYGLQLVQDPLSLSVSALCETLLQAAAPFGLLDDSTLVSEVSVSGCLGFAALGHLPAIAAPRIHLEIRDQTVAAFDGLPLDPRGEFCGYDAGALLDNWTHVDRLDGQFTAVRADLRDDSFECVTDALSMHPLYYERLSDGWLVANSVEAIRGVSGASDPDPLGVSTWLALGWAADYRTMLAPVRALPPGSRTKFGRFGMRPRKSGGMAPLASISNGPRAGRDETAAMLDDMVGLTRSATTNGLPVKCPVTAGRDSRTVLALCIGAGGSPKTSTIGPPDDLDVVLGRQVAEHAGLPHSISEPGDFRQLEDLDSIIPTFISITDGLASLSQLQDIHDLHKPRDQVGVLVWGMGGEIARSGVGPITKFAANGPLVKHSADFQRRMLQAKLRDDIGILKPTAAQDAHGYVDRFVAERAAEGWKTPQIGEVFYTFERIGRWASAGFRRATSHDDLYSPFCTHAFVNYAFRMTPGERTRRATTGPRLFAYEWLERHRDAHREVCFANPDSPLFEWVDRAALERAFTIPQYDERPALTMLRVVTLAWYLEHVRTAGRVPSAGYNAGRSGSTRSP